MKTIYVVRHCRATGQSPGAPLTIEGERQAQKLAAFFANKGIERILSSPYNRAVQSVYPFAERSGIKVETNDHLKEWVMSVSPLVDWQAFLKQSFGDLDIIYEGGESGREAMTRGVPVIQEILDSTAEHAIIVTHGGLLTLMLKHFEPRIGYAEWVQLTNPDVYRLTFDESLYPQIEHMWKES